MMKSSWTVPQWNSCVSDKKQGADMSEIVFKNTDVSSLKPGTYITFSKTLSDTDAMLYAGISGDMSPLFLNEQFAAKTEFKTRTVHPMLVASIAGAAVYLLLSPAVRSVYRNFHFKAPVYAGDTVTAVATVESVDASRNQVELGIQCFNQNDELVLEGESEEIVIRQQNGAEM